MTTLIFFVSCLIRFKVRSNSLFISAFWSSASSRRTNFLRDATILLILSIASLSMLLISLTISAISASLICGINLDKIELFDLIDATGVLISCATPATSWPKEAIFSEFISCNWVSFSSESVFLSSSTVFRLSLYNFALIIALDNCDETAFRISNSSVNSRFW